MAVNDVVIVDTVKTTVIVDPSNEVFITNPDTSPKILNVLAGTQGVPGPAPVLNFGPITTGAAGSNASLTTTGDNFTGYTLNFTIPRGNTGATGPAPNMAIGTVANATPGTTATASITGANPNYVLNMNIPIANWTIGTVTTVAVGGSATASIGGTALNPTLNLGIPTGATGATGPAPTLNQPAVTTLAPTASPTASFTGSNPYTLNLGLPAAPQWRSGSGVPAGALGNQGDWYQNTNTTGLGDVYEKTGASTWTLRYNIRGASGAGNVSASPGTIGNLLTYAAADGSLVQDAGFAASDVMRMSATQSVSGAKTFAVGTNITLGANYASNQSLDGVRIQTAPASGVTYWETRWGIASNSGGSPRAGIRWITRDATNTIINDTEPISILSNGRVGIGVVAPTEILDVAGNVKATSFIGSGASLTSLNASNISTGTIADARLPVRLGLAGPSLGATDLNASSNNGWASATNTTTNTPSAGGYFNVLHMEYQTANYTSQIASEVNLKKLYYRQQTAGTYGSWSEFIFAEGAQTISGSKTFSTAPTLSSLTASRVVTTGTGGLLGVSAVTTTELGYLSGVTSAIQTQLGGKEPTIAAGTTAQYWRGDKTWQTLNAVTVDLTTNQTIGGAKTFTGILTSNTTLTDTGTTSPYGFGTSINVLPASDSSAQFRTTNLSANIPTSMSSALTGTVYGAWTEVRYAGTGNINTVVGLRATGALLPSTSQSFGQLTNVTGLEAQSLSEFSSSTITGVITNAVGFRVYGASKSNAGVVITNLYGIDVAAQNTGSTTNIGVRIAKADTYTLQLSDTGGTAAGGITFGTDTNLYRSSPSTLKTDGNFEAAGGLIYLNNPTSNWVHFGSLGLGAPTFTTRSVGTKLVLYASVGGASTDYAIGVESGSIWNSVGTAGNSFKWYGGTTLAATLTGAGNLTTTGSVTATSFTASSAGSRLATFSHTANAADGVVISNTDATNGANSPRLFFQNNESAKANAIYRSTGALVITTGGTPGTTSGAATFQFSDTGSIVATSFSGSGSALTSLNASNIGSGTVPIGNLPTGTTGTTIALGNHTHTGVYEPVISAGTTAQYYRGDKTWQTLNVGAVSGAAPTASPTFTGTVTVPDGSFTISKLSTTGTPTSSTFLAGNGAWTTVQTGLPSSEWVKSSVRAVATSNITLSGTQTIDSVVLNVGDRVLVVGQTTQANNGIYVVQSVAWTRAGDADIASELAGAVVGVNEGNVYGGSLWRINSWKAAYTVGSTAQFWYQILDSSYTPPPAPVDPIKTPVKAASTASIGGSLVGNNFTPTVGFSSMDGVSLSAGDRILLKNQSSLVTNGIWIWNSSSSLSRASDADTQSELAGSLVYVQQGSANGGHVFTIYTPVTGSIGSVDINVADYMDENEVSFSASTGNITFDLSQSRNFIGTSNLSGNVTPQFINIPSTGACTVTIIFRQGSTAKTINDPPSGTIKHVGGTFTSAASQDSVMTYYTADGGTTWYVSGASAS